MNIDEAIAHKAIRCICSGLSIIVGLAPFVFGILLL